MSRFFIERPILANVLAIVTILIGAVSLANLPVAQYPNIVPPTIQVSTSYPGASAQLVAETVGIPIEQAVNAEIAADRPIELAGSLQDAIANHFRLDPLRRVSPEESRSGIGPHPRLVRATGTAEGVGQDQGVLDELARAVPLANCEVGPQAGAHVHAAVDEQVQCPDDKGSNGGWVGVGEAVS